MDNFTLSPPPNYRFASTRNFQHDGSKEQLSIAEYLASVGCSDPDQVSKSMTHDLMTLKAPALQTMMDIFSKSKYQSFHEFVNNTSLADLRQNDYDTFTLFQQYQYYYNKDICSPLKQYLSESDRPSFDGSPNQILIQLSEIFNDCKKRAINMPENCAQQIDVFINLQSSPDKDDIHGEQYGQESDDDDDDDPEYAAQLREYAQSVQPKAMGAASTEKQWESHALSQGLGNIVRDHNVFKQITKFDKFEQLNYLRHELLINENSVQTLTTKDAIPRLAFSKYHKVTENTPLLRHYHTINAMKQMVDAAANLLCFSYHILQSTIQLFCYVYAADGRVYGQRVFTEDLKDIISSLYPIPKIRAATIDEMLQNIRTQNEEFVFDDDPMYEAYKLVLFLRGKYVDQLERKEVKTKMYIEYAQSNVKNKQNEVSVLREIAGAEAFPTDVSPYDEEECILEYAYISSPPTGIKIKISKEFIIQPLRMNIKEHFVNVDNLYHYIDISTSLQIKDREIKQISFGDQQICIINYDLHLKEEETECLYGVAVRVNNSWILDEFMTGDQIANSFNIDPESLPKSSRQTQAFKRKMSRLIITENVLDTTNWCNMDHNHGFITADDVPSKANTFKICRRKLIKQCKGSLEDPSLPQFRILVQDDDDYWIEWIKVIHVQYTSSFAFYTAIQYGYDQTQRSNLLKGLNDEPLEQLPYDIQVIVIEFCIPIQLKSIHHDPRYIYSLNKAVGNEESGSSMDQLLRLSPWPKQFDIGDFESEFAKTVKILNADPHRRSIDISLIRKRVIEQSIDFNYSYFLVNKFNVFRQGFPEFSHGRLKRVFIALRGEREIRNVDKKKVHYDKNWNVEPDIRYHTTESVFDAYIRIEILNKLSIHSVKLISMDLINLCYKFYA